MNSFHSWGYVQTSNFTTSSPLLLPWCSIGGPRSKLWLNAGFPNQYGRMMIDRTQGETHVEYVLKAPRVAVIFGRCSDSSQGRTPVWRIGSWVGGLSTMYDIQACHPGSICDLHSNCQELGHVHCNWRSVLTDPILFPWNPPISSALLFYQFRAS